MHVNVLKTIKCNKSGSIVFIHHMLFPCLKQAENTKLDALYVMLQIQEFVRDQENLRMPCERKQTHIRKWCDDMANTPDNVIRNHQYRIQHALASSIYRDVVLSEGMFHGKELYNKGGGKRTLRGTGRHGAI